MNKITSIKIKDKVMSFFKIWIFIFVIASETKQSQDKLLAANFIIRG